MNKLLFYQRNKNPNLFFLYIYIYYILSNPKLTTQIKISIYTPCIIHYSCISIHTYVYVTLKAHTCIKVQYAFILLNKIENEKEKNNSNIFSSHISLLSFSSIFQMKKLSLCVRQFDAVQININMVMKKKEKEKYDERTKEIEKQKMKAKQKKSKAKISSKNIRENLP